MSGHLAENVMYFARALRKAGVPVGPARVMEAVRAVETVGVHSRDDFYWALHATLLDRASQHEIFDQAFHVFWRDPQLRERMMALMLPQMPADEASDAELNRRLVEALFSSGESREGEEREIETDARESFSETELVRTKDFEQMTLAEQAEAKAALARLVLPLDERRTRRTRPATRGPQIDMRATMRSSLRAGATIPLKRREPITRPAPLVVLADISGSMSVYTRLFLHFLHALVNRRERVSCFLFGTRLHNITRQLARRDVDEAVAEITAGIDDWDGGTRIGTILHRFNVDWARRVLGQGAIVLLITDGLDRDAGAGIEPEIARLHRLTRRLIWLNPLLRYDRFEPKSLGIRALLPHVDEFRTVHNLAGVTDLVASLNGEPGNDWLAARGLTPRSAVATEKA